MAGKFPNYDDPLTGEPALPHPSSGSQPCEVVHTIVGAEGRGEIISGQYYPPSAECGESWSQVVVVLSGSIAGHQFDRWGSLSFRGVELLRLTTPEPTKAGISWQVERDVSDYASIFTEAGEVQLEVQNYVTPKYTGVFEFNVSFAFYAGKQVGAASPRTILPLRNVTGEHIDVTRVESQGQVYSIALPRDTVEARLDLFASAHGCEEFWYSNAMTVDESHKCGGGSYRELQVFVDGVLAGVQHPYPVMYTGGINPLLWRPLTGILSFDIPPYAFELTPFLAWLTDGQEHNITLQVKGAEQGFWFLNGVLALRQSGQPSLGGGVHVSSLTWADAPEFTEYFWMAGGEEEQQMNATQSYHVQGSLLLPSGENITSEVYGELTASAVNRRGPRSLSITGDWKGTHTSIYNGSERTTTLDFPLSLSWQRTDDNTSLRVEVSVKQRRTVDVQLGSRDAILNGGGFVVMFRDDQDNSALFNRTFDHKLNAMTGSGSELSQIWSGPADAIEDSCYEKSLASAEGAFILRDTKDHCTWPSGVYACGSSLCGDFVPNATATFVPGEPLASRLRAEGTLHADASSGFGSFDWEDLPPLRGPWQQMFDDDTVVVAAPTRGSTGLRGSAADRV